VLAGGKFEHLAIANPKIAPYGAAAKQTLERLKLWDSVSPKIIQGEDISQTMQFVVSGNAELGFIARSQAIDISSKTKGSIWLVPQDYYEPLKQEAVILSKGKDNPAATDFMEFLKGKEAREVISRNGYSLP